MPLLKSAKKALRQSVRRRELNLRKKNAIKEAGKNIRRLLAFGKIVDTKQLLAAAYKALDKAAKTGVLKKNTASRLKSRLAKRLEKATASK